MKQRSQSITFRGKAARLAFEAITGTKLPASTPKQQHTPGDWYFTQTRSGDFLVAVKDGNSSPVQIATVHSSDEHARISGDNLYANARLLAGAPALLAFACRITEWLDRAAKQSLAQAEANAGRFESLADACRADAENYAAMAEDGRAALEAAKKLP